MVALLAALLLAAQAPDAPRLVVPPNARDLTIKTRRISDGPGPGETEIAYFKGARQRRDLLIEIRSAQALRIRNGPSDILQCDAQRHLILAKESRTYAYQPIEDPSAYLDRARRSLQRGAASPEDGPEVAVTIDSNENGEQRQFGSYIARHVITTTIVDPSPGASMAPMKRVQDGWHIDALPPSGCIDWGGGSLAGFAYGTVLSAQSQAQDHVVIKRLGTAPLGFVIEETEQRTDPRHPALVQTSHLELLDFSEASLDPSLFEPPAGYRPALPTLSGGYDLTRPDTLWNRLQLYWEGITSWASRYLSR